MNESPRLPHPLTLGALQAYVAQMVLARGFTQDLDRVFILWVEELGELAEHLGTPEMPAAQRHALGSELADVTLYVADLANGFSIDLDAAVRALPGWTDLSISSHAALRDWQAALPALPQETIAQAVRRMVVTAGELARLVRKRWSGKHDGLPGMALAEALSETLRIACVYGIDLTRAIEDKESENARRTWTY